MFFKRLRAVERIADQNETHIANLVTSITKLGEKLEAIEKKLPDYEEAVARGVDDVWNKALSEIANYDPLAYGKKENNAE